MITYLDLVERLKSIASQHPLIKSVTSEYELTLGNCIQYPSISYSNDSVTVNENTVTITMTLRYAGLLTECAGNAVQLQSEGIDIINQIVAIFQSDDIVIDYTFGYGIQLFNRFNADRLAGAVASIAITIPNRIGVCDWFNPCLC